MKNYDLIVIGTGSGLELVQAMLQDNAEAKIAVIDKDQPGGICLTRGCIPSKLLIYPADVVSIIEKANEFGITAEIKNVNSAFVLERMRSLISKDINMIKNSLTQTQNIDYYTEIAEFIEPYTLKVGAETIKSNLIFLSIGSRPMVPKISGLQEAGYLTSDTILNLKELPKSIIIIGGGYIAAEYGHFLTKMGCKITIIGRDPRYISVEEPEISDLAKRKMGQYATIITNHEVTAVEKTPDGKKQVTALDRESQKELKVVADEVLVATGRMPNTDLLHPEKSGIQTDKRGFIVTNEYLETSQPGIWAMGDADGKFMFKHVANYESQIVYYNALQKNKVKTDYHAIPHAVFTEPEIASIGLKEQEAIEKYGKEKILIGFKLFEETAKGEAMNVKDGFVKVIVEKETEKILGAHIIGPSASVLIQEVINLMYTESQSYDPLIWAMHIHPALNEVVLYAFRSLMDPDNYHHYLKEHTNLSET